METIDTNQLAIEMLIQSRGGLSQRQCSARLGYRSNIVSHWEKGRRPIPSHSYFRLLALKDENNRQFLRRFFGTIPQVFETQSLETIEGVAALWRMLTDGLSQSRIAQALGSTRFRVARFEKAQTPIPVSDLLQVANLFDRQGTLLLAAALVDASRLEAIAERWQVLEQKLRLGRNPAFFVLSLMREMYPTADIDALAALIQHDTQVARECQRLGYSFRDSKQPLNELGNVEVSFDLIAKRNLRRWGANVGLRFASKPENADSDRLSTSIFSVSNQTLAALHTLSQRFYQQAKELIDADEGTPEAVGVLNAHLVVLAEREG